MANRGQGWIFVVIYYGGCMTMANVFGGIFRHLGFPLWADFLLAIGLCIIWCLALLHFSVTLEGVLINRATLAAHILKWIVVALAVVLFAVPLFYLAVAVGDLLNLLPYGWKP